MDLNDLERMVTQAEGTHAYARTLLAADATKGERLDSLVDALNSLARAEGALEAVTIAQRAWTYTARQDNAAVSDCAAAVREVLMDRVLTGADDGWSGRGNDARRARFDGFREAAQKVIRDL